MINLWDDDILQSQMGKMVETSGRKQWHVFEAQDAKMACGSLRYRETVCRPLGQGTDSSVHEESAEHGMFRLEKMLQVVEVPMADFGEMKFLNAIRMLFVEPVQDPRKILRRSNDYDQRDMLAPEHPFRMEEGGSCSDGVP